VPQESSWRGTQKRPRRGGGGARERRSANQGRSAVQCDAEDVGVREVVVHVRNDVGGAAGVLREVNEDGPNGRPGEGVGDGGGDSAGGVVVAVGDAQTVAGTGGVVGVVDQRLASAVEGGGGGGDGGHFCFLPWWLAVWLYCRRPPAVPSTRSCTNFLCQQSRPEGACHAQPHSGLPTVGGTGPAKVPRHHQALPDSARADTRPAERDR